MDTTSYESFEGLNCLELNNIVRLISVPAREASPQRHLSPELVFLIARIKEWLRQANLDNWDFALFIAWGYLMTPLVGAFCTCRASKLRMFEFETLDPWFNLGRNTSGEAVCFLKIEFLTRISPVSPSDDRLFSRAQEIPRS